MSADIEVRLLERGDIAMLRRVADEVFDGPVVRPLAEEFLADPRHHLAVAVDDGVVVGMASAVHYVHPDKPSELWVNELGVAPTHRRRGLAGRLMRALFEAGRAAGAREAWVLTERSNRPALRLYRRLGGVEPDDETVLLGFDLKAALSANAGGCPGGDEPGHEP